MMTVSTTKEKMNDYLIVTALPVCVTLLLSLVAMFHQPSQGRAITGSAISLGLLTGIGLAVGINELRD